MKAPTFPACSRSPRPIRNLSTIVVGESAWNIEQLWHRMYRFLYYNGMGGVVLAAISAIDIALYDIVGKKLGVPVYQLLGGKVQQTPARLRQRLDGGRREEPGGLCGADEGAGRQGLHRLQVRPVLGRRR